MSAQSEQAPPHVRARTFAEALQQRVGLTPGEPAVTFYDERTGERVELSYVTYANWVAKTASYLQAEAGLERGAVAAVDLPTHWLAPVWLGAVWSLGVAAGDAAAGDRADLVVCGPDGLERHAGGSADVVACSLLPMGGRFRIPLPPGVTDFGEVVWSQPDSLHVLDPASAEDVAWTDEHGVLDQAELLALTGPTGRVVTTVPPASRAGLPWLVVPLLRGVGTVWVAGDPADEWLTRTAAAERADVGER